ncbi:hypothetical protein EYR38_003603 [Pleurotus pulmonarius]|nr:hypothetical protein EYR38_003603 [Pleurotus pulmonarius]
MSPSRYSYSDAPTQSTDSEDASPRRAMRRITVSPSPSSEDSNGHYEEENSFDDADEVAATLNTLEDDINETEDLWTRTGSSTATPSSYSGTYSGSYTPTSSSLAPLPPTGTFPRAGHIPDPQIRLSIISERTEPSRPTSGAYSTTQYARPNAPTPDAHRRSGVSSHTRSSTDPNTDRELPPPGRAIELIARFETNSPGGGHLRTSSAPGGPRSPSPYMSASQSTPHLPSTAGYNYTSSYGYGSAYGYGSRSSSPSKSSSSISSSASEERISNTLSTLATQRAVTSTSGDTRFLTTDTGSQTPTGSRTGTGYLSPSAYTNTFTNTGSQTPTRTGTGYLSPSAYTGTFTNTGYTGTYTESDTFTGTGTTPTGSSLRRPQNISPRSPLTSVRNIVAAWKERTPASGARAGGRTSSVTSTTPPGEGEGGLFGIRRGARRVGQRIGQAIMGGPEESVTSATPRSARSSGLPPGLDIADLIPYTQTNEQPQHIGLLWYLNVHASPPYRWQRCQALLYPHMLLLSWLAPGGGRGIVAVDLLNCTNVQPVLTPTHPTARDDVGTIAAMRQSNEPDGQPLMDILVPFHMLYADGVERLAAESVHERSKWVHRISELLPPTPPSRTQSPTGSMRTILSIDTTSSSSSVGSRSTVFVPPLSSIPDISDDFDTRSTFSRTTSFISTHHTGTVDDTAILGQGYIYRGDPRVIAPSRGGSLRRTSSLTDMDQEFASALDRARGARPGLGFASRVILGGSPVTVSSGSSLGKDVFVTPPPSARGSSTPHGSSTDLSDEAFFSAGSGTSDTRTTSLYTLTSTGRDRTTTGFTSTGFTSTGFTGTNTTTDLTSGDSDTNIVSSTLSYRRTDSASYLGDSHDSDSYFSSGSSRTPLTRSSALSRRTGRSNSRSNSSGFPYSSDEASDKENSSNTVSGSSYTQSGTRSSDDTGYDVCHSSDLSALTLNSYSTYSYSTASSSEFSEVPPSSAPSSDIFASASEGSGSYVTAASPASTAFESLPSIPSESEYGTADEAASTEYATASEPSEYITAEVCPSEPGTEYLTAIEPREIPSELSTPKASPSLHLESEVEYDVEPDIAEEEQIEKELVLSDESPEEAETESILPSPSEVPTIVTTESEGDDLLDPSNIPLPPSLPPSISSLSSITLDEVTPSFSPSSEPTTVPTPSSISFSATELTESSLPGPSPIGTEPASTPLLPLSSVSSISESSLTPTPSSLTPSSPLEIARSVPATPVTISPSLWASETDDSYESSVLAASASVVTMANEGPDFSYDTSILRPTGSVISSPDRLTTIPETVLETPSRFTSLPPVTPVQRPSPPLPPIPITESAEPAAPVEPVEFAESDISSSTPPTASDLTLSSTTESPSLITESSLSRSSEQESSYVSSSTVSSLLPSEEVLPVAGPEDIPDDVSTIPSLLSTPRAAIVRPLSPSSISLVSTSPSLLMSPQLPTPEDVTMSVSISTPRGDTPSIHSLDSQRTPTMSVASVRTDRSISNDIRRLADDLHRMDDVRGEENRELADHIQALRHELHDLSEYLRRTPSPILHADKRDQKVGGSSLLSVDRATPKGPTELSVPTPPGSNLSRANSIASSMVSYLSSHHSDDYSLYGGSPAIEERELEPAIEEEWRIPSPQSSTTSSSSLSSSSPYSSSSTSLPTPHSIASTPPVPSLVSHSTSTSSTSTSSTSTVRARPAFPNLAPALDGIRDKLNALWDGQLSTNHILDELRAHRPGMPEPAGPDVEMHNRLQRIEGLVQSLLDRPIPIQQAPAPPFPQPEIHRDQPRQPTDDSSEAPSSDSSSDYINGLINALNDLRTNPPEPHIQMPIPQTAGPSLAQQLEEILSSTAPVPLQLSRARHHLYHSVISQWVLVLVALALCHFGTCCGDLARSPLCLTFAISLRHPERAGVFEPIHAGDILYILRRLRRAPLYQLPLRLVILPLNNCAMRVEVLRLKESLDGVGPTPQPVFPPRDTTSSAPLPDWYRPSPQPGVPPPPVLDQPAQPRASTQQRTYLPMPAGPTIVQLPPLFENLMEILRENRLAQLATVDQQRELMRYMRGLNEWLARDVHDRQAELRGVAARVEDLTASIRHLGAQPRRDRHDDSSGESGDAYPMPMPMPMAQPGPTPSMPVPQTGMPQPMFTPFPPGFVPGGGGPVFVPGGGGVIPPVVPDHSPPYDNGRPVIPDMQPPLVIHQQPVIPGYQHMGMPPPGMVSAQDEPPVRPYIPPEPSASGSPTPYQVRPPGYGPTISATKSTSITPFRTFRAITPFKREEWKQKSRQARRSSSSSGPRTPIIIPGQSQIPQVQVIPGPPVVSVQPGPQYVPSAATIPRPGSPRHPDAPQHPTPSPQPMVINIPGQQPTMVPGMMPGPGGMMPGMMPGPGGMMPSQVGMMPTQVGTPGSQIPPTQVLLPQGSQFPGQYPPGQYAPGQFPPGGQQPTVVAIPGSRSPPFVVQTQPPTAMPMQPAPTPLIVTQSPSHRSRSRSRSRSPRSRPATYLPQPSQYTPSRPHTAMERPQDLVPTPLVVEVLLGDLDLVHIHHAEDVIVEAITMTDIPAIGMEEGTDVDIMMTGIAMVANILTVMTGIAPVPRAVVPQAVIITPDPDRTLRTVARKDVGVDHDQALDHVPALILLPVEDVTMMIRGHPADAHRLSLKPLAMAHLRPRTQPDRAPPPSEYQQPHIIAPSAEYSDQPSSPHFVTVPTRRPTQTSATPRPLTALSVAEHEEPGLPHTLSRVGRTPTGRSGTSGGRYSPAPSDYTGGRPPEVAHIPEDVRQRPPLVVVHPQPLCATYPRPLSTQYLLKIKATPHRPVVLQLIPQQCSESCTIAPIPHPLRPVTPFPGDLEAAEMTRERLDRMDDMERQLQHIAVDAHEAEELREREFRDHEEDRQRIFLDNEARRDHEVRERHDEIWSDLENRIAMLAPPPRPPASPPAPSTRPSVPPSMIEQEEPIIAGETMADTASVMESLRASQEAASLHAQSIMQTIQSEREEFARERDAASAERERLMADLQADRERMLEERDARIQALEDELAAVKGELENEKQQRVTEEAENRERERQQNIERDEMIRNQLSDITNLLQDQQAGLVQKRETMDERWQDKLDRRQDKDYKWIELRDMVNKIHDDLEADRREENERRFAAEQKPGIDQVMAELQRQNGELRELLHNMSNDIRTECGQQHEETLNAVRASAQEQVSFNVQGYLDDFSKLLASEVKMLLGEVGKLREEKRSLKHEVGFLLCVQSKYGPGGEYEPEWKPPAPPGPPADVPPPEPPMPPEMPPAAKPGWRFTHRARPRRKKEQPPAPPPPGPSAMQMPPGMDPRMDPRRQVQSWATWQPDPHLVPTPPSVEPTLIVPERGSPGLFGPRSPRSSYNG